MKKINYFIIRELNSEQPNIGVIQATDERGFWESLHLACTDYFDSDINLLNTPAMEYCLDRKSVV